MNPTRLAIVGCTGRMGRALLRLAAADTGVCVVAAITRAGDEHIGADAGKLVGLKESGVRVESDFDVSADVLIDFTTPEATLQWAETAAGRRCALVSGTTGLLPAQHAILRDASTTIPVLWAANMSVGVNILLRLVRDAARALDREWDIEIVEAHHRNKADAPSGTAKALFDAARLDSEAAVKSGREGQSLRHPSEIGIHAVRMGGVVGDHDVHFASTGEMLTLSHRALSRDIFAAGAIRAAKWIAGKPPGLYTMNDVIGSGR